jgi:hypothetical protein
VQRSTGPWGIVSAFLPPSELSYDSWKDSPGLGCSKNMTNLNNESLEPSPVTTPQLNPESHSYRITNIRAGKGARAHIIYANLMDGEELLICATLEYITDRLDELLTGGYNTR